jgi:sterol carrier protein 2
MPTKAPAPAYILGVGLTRFTKPRGKIDYTELGYEAGIKALLDAHITYDDVEQGVACYCYGDSTCGQRVFYQFGMTGIPIYNTNNNCATASTGLVMARNAIAYGSADCVLVVGFEKMSPGSLKRTWTDRADPLARSVEMAKKIREVGDGSTAIQFFSNAGTEYIEK